MKITMYGAPICNNCVDALEQFNHHPEIELDYRNITKDTATLKEFLAYRDHEDMFLEVKEKGRIGIPFFILEDGTKTLEINDFLEIEKTTADEATNACSIDGKGNC